MKVQGRDIHEGADIMGRAYVKTAAGRREIEDRALRLPTVPRSILLMIDGRRSDSELAELAVGLHAPAVRWNSWPHPG